MSSAICDLRFEVVHGTTPSTLLALEPRIRARRLLRAQTSGVTAGAIYRFQRMLIRRRGRFDLLDGDPVTGDPRAPSISSYLRVIDEHARIGVNWQWKNRPTFNDDEVNARFRVTIGLLRVHMRNRSGAILLRTLGGF